GLEGAELVEPRKRLDDRRVELRPRARAKTAQCLVVRQPASIRPVARHRVERIADVHDARLERDLAAADAVRVPLAVPALVRRAYDRPNVGETIDRREDPRAEHRMLPDELELRVGQRPRLPEDLGRDADLADVVEERAELEPFHRLAVEVELLP